MSRPSTVSPSSLTTEVPLVAGGGPLQSLRTLDAVARRAFDLVVGAALLVVLSPVILIAIVTIKIDSRGPAFYRARRVGWQGRELWMLKFRKMTDGAVGAKLTAERDDRLTRVGVWLTRLKLDEIPQLWHVVCGEMSLVGPRPEDPDFVALVHDEYETILKVRPGITGYSQLAFAEESNILDLGDPMAHYIGRLFPQKLGLDKLYASKQSLHLNLRILLWTVAAVILRRPVAVNRATGKMNLRLR